VTLDEARALVEGAMWTRPRNARSLITLRRAGAEWTGIPTGVFTEPAIRLEQADGRAVVIVLNGTVVVRDA
jgi:hypothetical protein